MIVPVTVTASVVPTPCFLPFDSGCANASGASSAQQARMVIVFFILCLLLMAVLDLLVTLYKGIPGRVLHVISLVICIRHDPTQKLGAALLDKMRLVHH